MSNMTIKKFAEALGHTEEALTERMKQDGIMQNTDPVRPYREYVRRGYFDVTEFKGYVLDVSLTGKGQIWLARLFPAGFVFGAK
jgi:phage antirepressor YoqD-like protein